MPLRCINRSDFGFLNFNIRLGDKCASPFRPTGIYCNEKKFLLIPHDWKILIRDWTSNRIELWIDRLVHIVLKWHEYNPTFILVNYPQRLRKFHIYFFSLNPSQMHWTSCPTQLQAIYFPAKGTAISMATIPSQLSVCLYRMFTFSFRISGSEALCMFHVWTARFENSHSS